MFGIFKYLSYSSKLKYFIIIVISWNLSPKDSPSETYIHFIWRCPGWYKSNSKFTSSSTSSMHKEQFCYRPCYRYVVSSNLPNEAIWKVVPRVSVSVLGGSAQRACTAVGVCVGANYTFLKLCRQLLWPLIKSYYTHTNRVF